MKILRLALRSLFHFRLYSLINVCGLALSLLCSVVIFRYAYGELTANHHYSRIDRMYVPIGETHFSSGKLGFVSLKEFHPAFDPANSFGASFDFTEGVAGIESKTSVSMPQKETVEVGGKNISSKVLAGRSNFFSIFDYPLIAGVIDSIAWKKQAVVTQDFARRTFGDKDPLGEQIKRHNGETMTITGIIGNTSTKSTIDFDIFAPGSPSLPIKQVEVLVLHPHQDPKQIEKRLNERLEEAKEFMRLKEIHSSVSSRAPIILLPYKDLYMTDRLTNYPELNFGSKLNVTLLLTVGALLLFIGCVNFINIYTAVTMRRGRELGMKKVFGAGGWKIFQQLWAENFVMVGLAIVAALSMAEVFSPLVKNSLGLDQLPFNGFDYMVVGLVLLLLPTLTTLFPFVRYCYSSPITTLRSVGKTGGKSLFRNVFLSIQYVTTIFMIILSVFFVRHLNRMLNTDIGFRADDIIKVDPIKKEYVIFKDGVPQPIFALGGTNDSMVETDRMFLQRIASSPLFENVILGTSPVNPQYSIVRYRIPEGEYVDIRMVSVSDKWLELFEIIPYEGDYHSSYIMGDQNSMRKRELILTDQASKVLGIKNWRGAVVEDEEMVTKCIKNLSINIIGITKDFNGFYLGSRAEPVIIDVSPHIGVIYTKDMERLPLMASIAPGKRQEAIAFLRALYDELAQGQFNYTFIEDEVAAMYDEDRKVAFIYSIFTLIAILVSMLGLFSMSLFDIEQRYNEIAVRKVNGASTWQIIVLLLRKYAVLLVISSAIAAPLAGLILTRYMENFAFRTPISWWIFALALIVSAAVSLLTLLIQTRKAAETNPAAVIRNE